MPTNTSLSQVEQAMLDTGHYRMATKPIVHLVVSKALGHRTRHC